MIRKYSPATVYECSTCRERFVGGPEEEDKSARSWVGRHRNWHRGPGEKRTAASQSPPHWYKGGSRSEDFE